MPKSSPKSTRRSRGFCFTWNNYPETWRNTLDNLSTSYWVVGEEAAPSTGTKHLQGYVYFTNARSFNSIREQLPGCHVLIARGSSKQNRDYCSKEGKFHESGVLPGDDESRGSGERARWDHALASARAGKLEDVPADIYIRYLLVL